LLKTTGRLNIKISVQVRCMKVLQVMGLGVNCTGQPKPTIHDKLLLNKTSLISVHYALLYAFTELYFIIPMKTENITSKT